MPMTVIPRTRATTVSLALLLVIAVTFCVSISVGDFPIPIFDVVPAIFGHGNPDSDFIIRQLRYPEP